MGQSKVFRSVMTFTPLSWKIFWPAKLFRFPEFINLSGIYYEPEQIFLHNLSFMAYQDKMALQVKFEKYPDLFSRFSSLSYHCFQVLVKLGLRSSKTSRHQSELTACFHFTDRECVRLSVRTKLLAADGVQVPGQEGGPHHGQGGEGVT